MTTFGLVTPVHETRHRDTGAKGNYIRYLCQRALGNQYRWTSSWSYHRRKGMTQSTYA